MDNIEMFVGGGGEVSYCRRNVHNGLHLIALHVG